MLIKFTRGTALGGSGNDAEPGDVCELPTAQALALIQQGRACAVAAPAPSSDAEPAADTPRKPKPKAK